MPKRFTTNFLHIFFAGIWIANGLFCKVFNLVPRHREIVDRILDTDYTSSITVAIGIAETGMAIWILSGVRKRLSAVLQIIVIAVMNTIEFFLAPDLLLWGHYNALFAFLLIALIYLNEFYFSAAKRPKQYA